MRMILGILCALLISGMRLYAQATIEDLIFYRGQGLAEEAILENVRKLGGFELRPEHYTHLRQQGFDTAFLQALGQLSPQPKFPPWPSRWGNLSAKPAFGVGTLWLLAIGLNHYGDEEFLPALHYAVADAQALVKHFLSLGVPANQIALLTDEAATSQAVESLVQELLKGKGTLYFFFSGHGLCRSEEVFYLACYNTQKQALAETAYGIERLKRQLEKMQAGRAVILLDACHSGGAKAAEYEIDDQPQISLGPTNSRVHKTIKALAGYSKPLAILTSCREYQLSREGKGLGLFTESLLSALAKGADQNGDGWVTVKELFYQVNASLTEKTGTQQMPDCSFSPTWEREPEQGLPIPSWSEFLHTENEAKKPAEKPVSFSAMPVDQEGQERGQFQPGEPVQIRVHWQNFSASPSLAHLEVYGQVVRYYQKRWLISPGSGEMNCPVEWIGLSQGYLEVAVRLYVDGRSQKQRVRFWVGTRRWQDSWAQQLGLSAAQVEPLIYRHAGQEILDLAGDAWAGLSLAEQMQYARAYQQSYAGQLGVESVKIVPTGDLPVRLLFIPPGRFGMGSAPQEDQRDGDEEQHPVLIDQPFWISQTEVTQGQWNAVMHSNPSRFPGNNRPVERVDWANCQAFCDKLALRLPSEAEWEYACRAGTTYAFSLGETISSKIVNYDDTPEDSSSLATDEGATAPAGSLPNANNWGGFDFHGNVWEWCADWYAAYPLKPSLFPASSSQNSYRVCRGGSWDTPARKCRSAHRNGYAPTERHDSLGFRPAKSFP